MAITHKKNLAGASNGNANQVQPGDWNDNHHLTGLLALLDAAAIVNDRIITVGVDGTIILVPKSTILLGDSPALTGTPTAPTAAPGSNTQQIATTAFVAAAVAALIASAPGALNTLDELAAALGDDANFAATVTTALAGKAPLASPALTGNPTVPNQAALTNNTRAANTAYADAAVAALAAQVAAVGTVVASSLTVYNSAHGGAATAVPIDDSVPTISEGNEILTTSFTPKSVTNKLRCTFTCTVSAAAPQNAVGSIFAGSTNIGSQCVIIAAADHKNSMVVVGEYTPGSIAAQTISVRVGGSGTIYVNGTSAGRVMGGAQKATLLIEEIKG